MLILHCRYIIHYDLPRSFEGEIIWFHLFVCANTFVHHTGYYQETGAPSHGLSTRIELIDIIGRAGRDGAVSYLRIELYAVDKEKAVKMYSLLLCVPTNLFADIFSDQFQAREDAMMIKRLISAPHPQRLREDMEGPTPTQRARDSLTAVCSAISFYLQV